MIRIMTPVTKAAIRVMTLTIGLAFRAKFTARMAAARTPKTPARMVTTVAFS